MSTRLALLVLLGLASSAGAYTAAKGYSDTSSPRFLWIPAGGCNNTTAGSNFDIYATDPVAACVTGTVIKKGVLTFDDTNTCTSTSATTGCAFTAVKLPADFAGTLDARLFFTSTDTTNGHTIKWTISTKCSTPVSPGAGAVDDPATLNAAQTMTYTCGASEVSASLRYVSQAGVTLTGCSAGDFLHVRIGRDVSDTATTNLNFVGLELVPYLAQ